MKIAHDLPMLYFSSDVKAVGGADFKEITKMDMDAGPVAGETGIDGLRLDFNAGLRLRVPKGNWRIRISDADSEQVFLDQEVSGQVLISMEKYYIHWQIEAYLDGELKFAHIFDPEGMEVLFSPIRTPLGDAVMLFPYIRAFVRAHGCQGLILSNPAYDSVLRAFFPEFRIVERITETTYAQYLIGAFHTPPFLLPDSARVLPANYVGRYLLGLHEDPSRNVFHALRSRQIAEPYVCVAVQASGVAKCWLYPGGWEVVVDYLKTLGYRVLCIDRERRNEDDRGNVVFMPAGAEDYTGDCPLLERIEILAHADFFIGCGSGLSWLADATGCPVVLISGISMPYAEFDTPYRVMNPLVCHGCYNDATVNWVDPLCPRHHDTKREYECSRKISPRMVIAAIDRLREDFARKRTEPHHA